MLKSEGLKRPERADRLKSGEGGIRTPDAGITDVTVFETAAFNHSATSPPLSLSTHPWPFNHPLRSTFHRGPAYSEFEVQGYSQIPEEGFGRPGPRTAVSSQQGESPVFAGIMLWQTAPEH
jgi:hypothetical protein